MLLIEPIVITVVALLGLGMMAWMLCALEPMADWMNGDDDGMALRLNAADLRIGSDELVSR